MVEIQSQLREMQTEGLDVLVIPCGSGGLLSGSAIFAKEKGIRVSGAEPRQGGPHLSMGIETGVRVVNPSVDTIADGLRSAVSPLNWSILAQSDYVYEVYAVTEDEIRSALGLFVSSGEIIEPSAAVPLAVVLYNLKFREDVMSAKSRQRVCIILSGGNITQERIHELLG